MESAERARKATLGLRLSIMQESGRRLPDLIGGSTSILWVNRANFILPVQDRRPPPPPHLSRISLHFGCISQTIAFSEASHDRRADVVICEFRCMDSLQSNVIRLTGCGGGMYNLTHLFSTSFKH